MQTGAIILCGGQSTRMGRDKALLPFGPELMLQRVIRLLSEVVERQRIVVVAALDQRLPALPGDITVARDRRPRRGPLEGLAAGLGAVPPNIHAVYATSCDVPLLVPTFVAQMFECLEDYDIAVPLEGERFHPLAAVYRPSILPLVHQLLHGDRLRLRSLFDVAKTRSVPVDKLRAADPDLRTLVNLNHADDYEATLKAAGLQGN